MNWTNIRLIVSREIRDQLRDRRTIFVILVLPLLLYPLLGMSFLQVSQFMREHPTKIWVIGNEHLPEKPSLLADNQFRADLLTMPTDARLFELSTDPIAPGEDVAEVANAAVQTGKYDAVLFFSEEFANQVCELADSPDWGKPLSKQIRIRTSPSLKLRAKTLAQKSSTTSQRTSLGSLTIVWS